MKGFAYCPYCGVPLRRGPGPAEALESFAELESMQAASRARRIDELLAALDGIESDVESILESNV